MMGSADGAPERGEPQPGGLHVVLLRPEIPGNAGNAGRTCLAAGARLHLVRPLGFAADGAAVRRAGLDYWEQVAPVVWPTWEALVERLPALGEPFFLTRDGVRDLWSVRFPRPAVLVFGSESAGLPPDLRRRHRRRTVAIPVAPGTVRSLNLSTSVGIAVYEVLRQWRQAAGEGAPPEGDPRAARRVVRP